MSLQLEYHNAVIGSVQRPIRLTLALFGLLLLSISPASAQQNNSAGHAGGSPTSVTVTPHTGAFTPPTGAAHNASSNWSTTHTTNHANSHNNNQNHNPQHNGHYPYGYGYGYAYGVPYAVDNSGSNYATDDSDADCQAGPTVFDRCGSGPAAPPSYNAQASGPAPVPQAAFADDPSPDSDPGPTTPTTLVFKDGHQIEVDNYAIVGQSLYDLTPGHHRKIALADLDIPATQKQNDDNGNSFELPASAQAN
jgi:hypothetical protein